LRRKARTVMRNTPYPLFDCWCRSEMPIRQRPFGPMGAATFDDWGNGPMCVMCGRIKEADDEQAHP